MGDLTTVESVKRLLAKTDSQHDDLIRMIVAGVSQRMETYMGRVIGAEDYTGEPVASPGYPFIVLDHGPITKVVSVTEGATVLTDADYRVELPTMLARLSNGVVAAWARVDVLVTYEAGYVDVPADLDWACVMQCAREYGFTKPGGATLGVTRNSPTQASGESTSYETKAWLPQVEATMKAYKVLM